MTTRRAVLTFVLAFAPAGTAQAVTAPEGDALIKHFLAAKKTPDMDASETGKAVADLNGDGKPELVLVWA